MGRCSGPCVYQCVVCHLQKRYVICEARGIGKYTSALAQAPNSQAIANLKAHVRGLEAFTPKKESPITFDRASVVEFRGNQPESVKLEFQRFGFVDTIPKSVSILGPSPYVPQQYLC